MAIKLNIEAAKQLEPKKSGREAFATAEEFAAAERHLAIALGHAPSIRQTAAAMGVSKSTVIVYRRRVRQFRA